jgi:PTS system ascorbate-specific IIC component
MGFLILGAGAGVVSGALAHFGTMFEFAFDIRGVIPNNEVIVALAQGSLGTQTATIMLCGMLLNILFARITPFKYIFLTGHHMLFMACLFAAVLNTGGMSGAPLIAVGALLLGTWMTISPAILQRYVKQITGTDDIAVGHFGSVGYWVAGTVGKLTGDKSKSTEDVKVPQSLGFLRDSSVAISITMAIMFVLTALFAGQDFVQTNLSNGGNFIVFALIQAITFAAGVFVILAGTRMLIAEIVPAFKGIADKIVPNARPAMDCPVVFPFAPNAVIIGFLSSFVAGIISMFLLPLFGLAVIVPGLVPHFFCGATAGVFGNATGGRRGAIIGAFVQGILISFLPAILIPVLGSLGFEGTTFGDADFGVLGTILGYIMRLFV